MERIRVIDTEDKLLSFCGGYFRVECERGIGIVDTEGEVRVLPRFTDVLIAPEDGPVELFIRKRWNEQLGETLFDFVDTKGKVISQDNRGDCIGFREGIGVVKNLYGAKCIDKYGHTRFKLQGDHYNSSSWLGLFHDGLLRIPHKLGFYYYYVNEKGEQINKKAYLGAADFHENLTVVAVERPLKGNVCGVMNRKGEWLVRPKYDSISNYSNHRAIVRSKDKMGAIDSLGELRIPLVWDELHSFTDPEMTFAKMNYPRLACMIDRQGKEKLYLPSETEYCRDFSDGYAAAKVGDNWGFVDSEGKWAIEPTYKEVSDFCNGLALVNEDGVVFFINEKGECVLKPEDKPRAAAKGLAFSENHIYNFGYSK